MEADRGEGRHNLDRESEPYNCGRKARAAASVREYQTIQARAPSGGLPGTFRIKAIGTGRTERNSCSFQNLVHPAKAAAGILVMPLPMVAAVQACACVKRAVPNGDDVVGNGDAG